MMANSPADILVELEEAVATCPLDRCSRILEGVVQLLAGSHDRSHDMLCGVVDGVLLRLIARVDTGALVQLSTTLAGFKMAPPETLRRLASHDDPDVACPLLLNSQAIPAADLAALVVSCGEPQLRAIAARSAIAPAVTEALIARGGPICLALIKNPGTQFSDAAYAALIALAGQDAEIMKELALRPGTPDLVVKQLLSASPGKPAPARKEPAKNEPAKNEPAKAEPAKPGASAAPAPLRRPSSAEYASARPEIVALNRVGKLNDSTVNRFAIRGEIANLLTALSVLSGAPIEIVEHVMTDDDCEGLVMACRASRLNWATTLAILSNRSGARLSFAERERAQQLFETLLLSTSQWTVRWGEIAAGAKTGAGPSDPGHRGAGMGNSR